MDGERPLCPTNPALTEVFWMLVQQCWDRKANQRLKALEILRSL